MKISHLVVISILSIILFNCEESKNIIGPSDIHDIKILYNSESHIFMMDSDGSNKKNLTENLIIGEYSGVGVNDVSSDGLKILFSHHATDTIEWDTKYTTYIMDINGQNKERLNNTSLRPFHPKFSPDGLYIVFDATENVDDIYIMNSDGSNIRNLTNDSDRDWFPQFTPDGSKIIYRSEKNDNMDIYSINFDGTNKTNLTNDGKLWGAHYCISSDGSKIVYTSSKDGQSNLYLMNIDGTNQIKLTNSVGNANASFSYDNLKVVYISWAISGYDIKTIDIDGKNEKTVASTQRPAQNDYWRPNALFCPDNENIIFTCHNDDNNEIYMVDINGENLTNLTNNPNEDYLGLIVLK
ncbi:TolB family protein [candidate division KSB1 bacterium]|nr:TolB family protein [candidate division KSB1 bacterium]